MLCQNRNEMCSRSKMKLRKRNVTWKSVKARFFENAVFFHVIKFSHEANLDQLSLLFSNIDSVGVRHLKKVYEFKEEPSSPKYTPICLIGFFEKQRLFETSPYKELIADIQNRDINLDVDNKQIMLRERFDLFLDTYKRCDGLAKNQNRNILLIDYVDTLQYSFTQYLQLLIEKKIPQSQQNQPIFKQLILDSFQEKKQQRRCVWLINTHMEPFQFHILLDSKQTSQKEIILYKVSKTIVYHAKDTQSYQELLSKNEKNKPGVNYDHSVVIHTDSIFDSINRFYPKNQQRNISRKCFIEDIQVELNKKKHFLLYIHEKQKDFQASFAQLKNQKIEANFPEVRTFEASSKLYSFLEVFEHPDTIILKSLNFPKNYGQFQKVTKFLKIPEHRNGKLDQIEQLLEEIKNREKISFKQRAGKHETVIIAESAKKSIQVFQALVEENLKQISFLTQNQIERLI